MIQLKSKFLTAMAALALSTSVGATLIGQQVTITGPAGTPGCGQSIGDPNAATSSTVTVGTGIECTITDGSTTGVSGAMTTNSDQITIDISDSAIVFGFISSDTEWNWLQPSGGDFTFTISDLFWLDSAGSIITDSYIESIFVNPLAENVTHEGDAPEVDADTGAVGNNTLEFTVFNSPEALVWSGCDNFTNDICATLTVDITGAHPTPPPIDTPEPTTLALLGLGLAGLGMRRKKV
jgi:hypothetical protein